MDEAKSLYHFKYDLFPAELGHLWPVVTSAKWTRRPFDMTLVCGGFLALWGIWVFWALLVYFLLQTRNRPFLQKAVVYFCKKLHFKTTVGGLLGGSAY